jgi:predicted DNA-binding transcriptional regulator AlpA
MRLLNFAALQAKGHPFTRRHTERLVKEGKFPKPIHAGEHRIAWIESEVDAHYSELAARRDQGAAA